MLTEITSWRLDCQLKTTYQFGKTKTTRKYEYKHQQMPSLANQIKGNSKTNSFLVSHILLLLISPRD